ncbi:MAG: rRNA methyltransferase [Thermoprotei archaeon]|nr:MAG: rRNA methyltransferase [Thermoprotei archaeon]
MTWRARGDHYYRLARARGYRSRAAFKLLEAIERFDLVRPGDIVVDLGCAPGSWLQVASEAVGPSGFVLGVDLRPVSPLGLDNVRAIVLDVLDPGAPGRIRAELPDEADVLLSDLAPSTTGVRELDHARQMELAWRALEIARGVLRPGGRALIKASQGGMLHGFLRAMRRAFRTARLFKPRASRPESPEIYVIGLGLRAR